MKRGISKSEVEQVNVGSDLRNKVNTLGLFNYHCQTYQDGGQSAFIKALQAATFRFT